jgi:hypothetical protein
MIMPERKTVNPTGNPTFRDASPGQKVPEEDYKRDDFFRDLKKDEPDSRWEGFKDTLKKIAAVPKEEVDELRAKREQEKKRAR